MASLIEGLGEFPLLVARVSCRLGTELSGLNLRGFLRAVATTVEPTRASLRVETLVLSQGVEGVAPGLVYLRALEGGGAVTREGGEERIELNVSGLERLPVFNPEDRVEIDPDFWVHPTVPFGGLSRSSIAPSPESKVWSLRGDISVSAAEGLPSWRVENREFRLTGTVWLFKGLDGSEDASGLYRGRLFLPVRPVLFADRKGQKPTGASLNRQLKGSRSVWKEQVGIEIRNLGPAVLYQRGLRKNPDNEFVFSQFTPPAGVIPVFFVDQEVNEGGAVTQPAGTQFKVMVRDGDEGRDLLLAHELGHVLGGRHPTDQQPEPLWEGEDNTVLDLKDDADAPIPGLAGDKAKKHAPLFAQEEILRKPP